MLLYGRLQRAGELLQAFWADTLVEKKGSRRAEACSIVLLENMVMCVCVCDCAPILFPGVV